MSARLVAAIIFVSTYGLIVTEKVHRTIASVLGGMAVILLHLVSQEEGFIAIDLNVIFLLAGMMIIVSIMSETGVFQWTAVKAVRAGRGRPIVIMMLLALFTAVASAFLDNVTTVILFAPVTLYVTSHLRISPLPFLLAELLASNVGGAATLIGDPPNILIASAADYDFVTFAANMAPIAILALIVLLVLFRGLFGKELGRTASVDRPLEARNLISNWPLLRKSLVILGLVLAGFLLHGALGLEPATIALVGAFVLLLWAGKSPPDSLQQIEWSTLFFFIGLFILVESLVQVGVIEMVAKQILLLTEGSLPLTATALLWFSAIASGIVDNIPYTATMIPIVEQLGRVMPVGPLWWALAMGADFGGNLTLVGASANIVVVTMAERAGHPITFWGFLKYGAVTTFATVVLATGYLWLRYLW